MKTTKADRPRGYDAGEKVNGHERHIATDLAGNLLDAPTHPAGVQSLPLRRPGIAMAQRP